MSTTTYITRAQLEALFGTAEITKLGNEGAGVDATLSAVNAEVDSYVRAIRPAGLEEVPLSLERAAGDLARFYLYKANPMPVVEARWKAAVAYLRDVAAGKVALPAIADDPDTPEDESDQGGVWFTAPAWEPKGWM